MRNARPHNYLRSTVSLLLHPSAVLRPPRRNALPLHFPTLSNLFHTFFLSPSLFPNFVSADKEKGCKKKSNVYI